MEGNKNVRLGSMLSKKSPFCLGSTPRTWSPDSAESLFGDLLKPFSTASVIRYADTINGVPKYLESRHVRLQAAKLGQRHVR